MAPVHCTPHSYTANFSGSAVLHCNTAMCESTASLSPREPLPLPIAILKGLPATMHYLNTLQSSSTPLLHLSLNYSPSCLNKGQKMCLGIFQAGLLELNNGFLIKIFNMAAGVIAFLQNLCRECLYTVK